MSLVKDTCKMYDDPSMSNMFVCGDGVERYRSRDYRSYNFAMSHVKTQIKNFLLSGAERLGIVDARVSFYNMDFTALFGLNGVIILSNSLGGLKKSAMLNKVTLYSDGIGDTSRVSYKVQAKTDKAFTHELAGKLADSLSKFINE